MRSAGVKGGRAVAVVVSLIYQHEERVAQGIFAEQVLVAAADGGQVSGDGTGREAAFVEEVIAVVGQVGAVPELPDGVQPGDEFAEPVAVVAVGMRLQETAVGGGRSERRAFGETDMWSVYADGGGVLGG